MPKTRAQPKPKIKAKPTRVEKWVIKQDQDKRKAKPTAMTQVSEKAVARATRSPLATRMDPELFHDECRHQQD